MMGGGVDEALIAASTRLVARHCGVDFQDYRAEAVAHAIRGRLEVRGVDGHGYLALLATDADEALRLSTAIVVPHTRFFRDPEVFDALRATVIPRLAGDLAPGEVLRVWANGVATGEEAWSLGMVLEAALGGLDRFSLLATDLDPGYLSTAREGRYPLARLAGVPAEVVARHFVPAEGGQLQLEPRLRGKVVFAQHDVVGPRLAPVEAVIGSFHLVTCRNVLIWFDHRLQHLGSARLQAVVAEGGVLVMGGTELPAGLGDAFAPAADVAPQLRIFQRLGARAR